MAGVRVFVSSTCYDLVPIRAQLRGFLQSLGFEPIMSDYEEVLFDPRSHTHTSCIEDVSNCDMLVFIIGSRFGGNANEEALSKIDFEKLKDNNLNIENLKKDSNVSITQIEVLKAIEVGIPVYTFIEQKVWHDHELYERNKENDIAKDIIYPSIEKQEMARYIFEFINIVRLRSTGNSIHTFENAQEIETTLKKQWSNYFQRLLKEQRQNIEDRKRLDYLGEQFEDLKTAILSSIDMGDKREVASGVVKYRRALEFLFCLNGLDTTYLKTTKDSWEKVLDKAEIDQIYDFSEINIEPVNRTGIRLYLVCKDNTYYEMRGHRHLLEKFAEEWEDYIKISNNNRAVIVDTLKEIGRGYIPIRHIDEDFKNIIIKYNVNRPLRTYYDKGWEETPEE